MVNLVGSMLTPVETGPRPLDVVPEGVVYTPAVDIFETDTALEILADLPGASVEGLEVKLEKNVLTIYARVPEDEFEKATMMYQEFERGDYFRAFRLDGRFDPNQVEATLKNGVLHVVLPKAAESRPRKIQVKS